MQQYYFHSEAAETILKAMEREEQSVALSLDLNLSRGLYRIFRDRMMLDGGIVIDKAGLEKIKKKKNRVFLLNRDGISPLEFRDEGYYKLVPTDYAPTFEINGVKMHRSKDYDPFIDSKEKASQAVSAGDKVLDTCGGMGYTAIWARRLGACRVVTIEKNPVIRKLRKENPWSAELYGDGVTRISGDSNLEIQKFDPGSFDAVIHDPPRFSLAGELYGREFYRELLRVLKPGGRVFHYTGNPYRARKGNSFLMNAGKRMLAAGFKKVVPKEEYLGVLALK